MGSYAGCQTRWFIESELSSMMATSVCSSRECVDKIELYGSTTAVEIWGEGYTVKPSLDFFP